MKFFDVRGASVAVHIEGSAHSSRDIVLIHGAGSDHTTWRFQTRFLAARGFRVFAPDLPGHGGSGGQGLSTISDMSTWLFELIETIGSAVPIVIGHSMGSLVALETAARDPDSLGGIGLLATSDRMMVHPELLNSAADKDDHAVQLMVSWMHAGNQRLGGHQSPGSWSAGVTRRRIERNIDTLHADLNACDAYHPLEVVGSVRSPTLVVLGEEDRMTSAVSGESLANAIPQARLVVVPAVGHMLISDAPGVVNRAIVAFLCSTMAAR